MEFATEICVLVPPRSLTNHTVKNSVVMFIEKTVFAKSYHAHDQRSRAGTWAVGRISPSGRSTGGACGAWVIAIVESVWREGAGTRRRMVTED